MRSIKAEQVHADLTWFVADLQQALAETANAQTRRNAARLIRQATKDLRKIRTSYEPARPMLRRWLPWMQ